MDWRKPDGRKVLQNSPVRPRQQIWNGLEVEHMGKAKVVREVQNSLNGIQVPLLKRRFLSIKSSFCLCFLGVFRGMPRFLSP